MQQKLKAATPAKRPAERRDTYRPVARIAAQRQTSEGATQ